MERKPIFPLHLQMMSRVCCKSLLQERTALSRCLHKPPLDMRNSRELTRKIEKPRSSEAKGCRAYHNHILVISVMDILCLTHGNIQLNRTHQMSYIDCYFPLLASHWILDIQNIVLVLFFNIQSCTCYPMWWRLRELSQRICTQIFDVIHQTNNFLYV